MTLALIVLGLGWNFTYVGGGALLARSLESNPDAMQMQGINDLGISILATVGAFTPAILLSWIGWSGTNLLCIVLSAAVLLGSMILLGAPRTNLTMEGTRQ
ncbi:hypothetical protein D3C78_1324540 [compost metagenome]